MADAWPELGEDLEGVARQVALKATLTHGAVFDDVLQDALLYLATHEKMRDPERRSTLPRRLYHAVCTDKTRHDSDSALAGLVVSHPQRSERPSCGGWRYTELEVEEVLPLVWLPHLVECFRDAPENETGIRAASDPSRRHTDWARLADIRRAVRAVGLSRLELQGLFLLVVMRETPAAAGRMTGRDGRTVRDAAAAALTKITNILNGEK